MAISIQIIDDDPLRLLLQCRPAEAGYGVGPTASRPSIVQALTQFNAECMLTALQLP